jgi:hypothetical protein
MKKEDAMTKDQIPEFVQELVDVGCEITAVVGVGYVFGDADLPEERYGEIAPELSRIATKYGERGHLLKEITEYLISIGRCYPPPVRH